MELSLRIIVCQCGDLIMATLIEKNGTEGVKQLQQLRNTEAAGTITGIEAWVAPLAI